MSEKSGRKRLAIGAKPAAGEPDESSVRWLISYADFMMQLVCLFILLYSVSSLDESKLQAVSAAYRKYRGIEEPKSKVVTTAPDLAVKSREPEVFVRGEKGLGDVPKSPLFRVRQLKDGFRVDFTTVLFEPGSSILTSEARRALDQAAEFLRPYIGTVEITGTGGPMVEDGEFEKIAAARAGRALSHLTRDDAPAPLESRWLVPRARILGEAEKEEVGRVSLRLRAK